MDRPGPLKEKILLSKKNFFAPQKFLYLPVYLCLSKNLSNKKSEKVKTTIWIQAPTFRTSKHFLLS